MKRMNGEKVVQNDRLVIVWKKHDKDITGMSSMFIKQGKRVGKDCKLNRKERRAYVKYGTVSALREIRKRGMKLRDAKNLLDKARY